MRWRWPLIFVGVAATWSIAGWLGLRERNRLMQQGLTTAWSELSQCLIGAPLAPSEDLAARLEAVRKAAVRPRDPAARYEGDWPRVCATPAGQLYGMIPAIRMPHPALLRMRPHLRALYLDLEDRNQAGVPVEVWESAREAGLEAHPLASAKSAPAPLERFRGAPEPVAPEPELMARTGELLLGREICRLAVDELDRSVLDCAKPLTSTGPLWVADARDDNELWAFRWDRSGGNPRALTLYSRGAARQFELRKSDDIGQAQLLDEGHLLIVQPVDKADLVLTSLDTKGNAKRIVRKGQHFRPALLGDQVVWLESGALGNFVFAAKLNREPFVLEPARPLMPAALFRTCRGPKSMAVAALNEADHVQGLAVRTGEDWNTDELQFDAGADRLTCVDDGAVLTHISSKGELTEAHCTANGCETRKTDLGELPSVGFAVALPVGQRTVVVHRTTCRDYRVRVGQFDALPSLPDQLLVDDESAGPAYSRDGSFNSRVFAMDDGDTALLALESDRVKDGFYLFSIGSDGRIRAVTR